MVKKSSIPSAWDDDWEVAADKTEESPPAAPPDSPPASKISKAERLAKHAESNKKIWESAEAPTPDPTAFPYLSVHDSIPLKTEFKPALKVLSRKPAAKAVEVIDPVTGLARLRMEDEDEAEQAGAKPSPDELRERAQREREEKRRRYEEARARILGSGSGSASPGMVTPPVGGEDGRSSRAGKGRGRGGRGVENQRPGSGSGTRELFDPNYSPKTGSVTIQKRNGEGVSSRPDSGRSTPRNEDQIIRAPRGPDGSGRGGFGFVNRGGKNS